MSKKLLVLFLALGSGVVFAGEMEPQAFVSVRNISPCNYWTYNSSSGGGYVCSSYTSVAVSDGYQTQSALTALEERIRVLEEKLKNMEAEQ